MLVVETELRSYTCKANISASELSSQPFVLLICVIFFHSQGYETWTIILSPFTDVETDAQRRKATWPVQTDWGSDLHLPSPSLSLLLSVFAVLGIKPLYMLDKYLTPEPAFLPLVSVEMVLLCSLGFKLASNLNPSA